MHKETNGKLWTFLKLYKELIKKRGMSKEQVAKVVEIAIHKLPYMETLYRQIKDEVDNMQRTIQHLSNDIHALEYKISILDKTAFTCEQECKRKEQELRELFDKKNRIEKLITDILNGKGYSKIKQFVKENVKAVLSENKQVISLALIALLQTLKSDPQMINIIYKILTANNGEQQKDDNNDNVTRYFESYKDNILDLAEKNYENLVEVLTSNAISTAAVVSSSSNPTLPMPHSSSTFSSLSNQSDTCGIEESEINHNSGKGDIAE
jgi:hypothetical protein